MAMQRNRMIVLGLAGAVATWVLVDSVQSYLNESSSRSRSVQPIGKAGKDMPAGHRLVASDFDTGAPDGATQAARPAKAVGRILAVAVRKGQQIQDSDLAPQTSGEAIANQLQPGYRAITVTLRDSGPAVSLFPGALVDVLATVEAQGTGSSQREVVTRTVLERGRVLAVNEEALGARPSQSAVANAIDRRGSATSRKMTVTLAVTPEQASAVEFASARGTIGITVRADDDTTTPAAAPAPPSVATEKPAAEKPAVAAAAAPESDTGKWQTWDVLVIRGKDTERHSFANSPKPKAP